MKTTTVALLFGGRSNEYEVSGRSAATVLTSLRGAGYRVLPIGITRKGSAYLFRGHTDRIRMSTWEDTASLTPVWFGPRGEMLTSDGRAYTPDAVFPVLHGQNCEDGRIQGFLDTWGIPYVGCGTAASVLSWDKALTKRLVRDADIPTLDWVETSRPGAEECILSKLEFPLFIKPCLSGSSVGAACATDPASLTTALDNAACVGGRIIAEPCFTGRELEVAVLDDGEMTVSRVGEVVPNNTFYDYNTKYRADTARTYIPARIPERIAAMARNYAARIFEILGCRHLARVDFFTDDTHLFFNEINTMPGFTSISMYPRLMEDMGIPIPALVTRLVEAAIRDRGL